MLIRMRGRTSFLASNLSLDLQTRQIWMLDGSRQAYIREAAKYTPKPFHEIIYIFSAFDSPG
jgi:hypothetical protein